MNGIDEFLVETNLSVSNAIKTCISGRLLAYYQDDRVFTSDFSKLNSSESEAVNARKRSFEKVYKTRAWGHDWDLSHKGMNSSGMGSTLAWAQEMIGTLHHVITFLKHKTGLMN